MGPLTNDKPKALHSLSLANGPEARRALLPAGLPACEEGGENALPGGLTDLRENQVVLSGKKGKEFGKECGRMAEINVACE